MNQIGDHWAPTLSFPPKKTQEKDLSQKDNALHNHKYFEEKHIFFGDKQTPPNPVPDSHSQTGYNQILSFDSIALDYQISTFGVVMATDGGDPPIAIGKWFPKELGRH